MNDIRLILANDDEIEVAEFTMPMNVIVIGSKEDVLNAWGKLTEEALNEVSVYADGARLMTMRYVKIDSVQFIRNSDDSYTGHFYMSSYSAQSAENEYEMVAKILLGEVD